MSKSKLPVGAKVETVPFSPTLKALLAEYQQQFAQRCQDALNTEAKHLGYPEGTRFDFPKQMWLLAQPKESP